MHPWTFIYLYLDLWICGNSASHSGLVLFCPIPSPVSCLRSLLLCLFVCLFATIPTAKAVSAGKTARGATGERGKVELGPLAFLHIAHTQRCRWSKSLHSAVCFIKNYQKMKIKARRSKLSPRNYFNSNLFCVCSKRVEMRVAPARIFRTIFLFVRSLSQLDCWMIMTMARSKDQNQDSTSSSGFQKRSPNGKWVLCECS